MIDQAIYDMEKDLRQVKVETVSIMAEETRCQTKYDECAKEVKKYEEFAKKAVLAGNDIDATKFLKEKSKKQEELNSYAAVLETAKVNSEKMKQMFEKLNGQITELNSKRSSIKAKLGVAKTQDKINKISGAERNFGGSESLFNRMEEKADRMLNMANAESELMSMSSGDDVKDLESKYSKDDYSSVEDELALLKSQLLSSNDGNTAE